MTSQEKIKRLPRYTSYPTALEFKELGTVTYRHWLSSLNESDAISLYIHIPYCHQLCWFCGCFMTVSNKNETISKYVAYLTKEIALISKITGKKKVSHIHFGGGSPTILQPDNFEAIMSVIKDKFNIDPHAEIAVEIDPRTLSEEKVRVYSDCGVNRVSMGIQDFDPDVQKAINRRQSQALIEKCLGWLTKHGIDDINFDLIYGLPRQTLKSMKNTIQKALLYRPSRISLFGYAHVPWVKKHMKMIKKNDLPKQSARKEMFECCSAALLEKGYEAIGLDHFALPEDALVRAKNSGRLKRNFQGYTTDSATTMIGLGISSIGSFPDGFAQNTPSFPEYFQEISAGNIPVKKGLKINKDDLMRRDIISELMCYAKFDPWEISRKHGMAAHFDDEFLALNKLVEQGFLTQNKTSFSLSKKGLPFRRAVATVFDQYFPQETDIIARCLHESEG